MNKEDSTVHKMKKIFTKGEHKAAAEQLSMEDGTSPPQVETYISVDQQHGIIERTPVYRWNFKEQLLHLLNDPKFMHTIDLVVDEDAPFTTEDRTMQSAFLPSVIFVDTDGRKK